MYAGGGHFCNALLLAESLLFYAWGNPKHLLIMLFSVLANYAVGLWIDCAKRKKFALAAGVLLNIALLGYFKYFGMMVHLYERLTGNILENIKLVALPIGISFYTFQSMSYLIDLYRGKFPVQKSLVKLALYISLFPQLIAGPIVQYGDVVNQMDARTVTWQDMAYGIKRFIYGFSKKMIFSNGFALVADGVFSHEPAQLTTGAAWLGAVAYTLQIYYDFSGYSDMAIGLGKMLGFDFLENFKYPYLSGTVTEFWRRWHISLSSWFKEYLYIPLGGNRKGMLRTLVNLGIVFAVTGLWHGAEPQFVIWGLYHGLFLIAERLILKKREPKGLFAVIGHFYTLLAVTIGWVIFRAQGMRYALAYIQRMFTLATENIPYTFTRFADARVVTLFILGMLFCGLVQKLIPGLQAALYDREKTGVLQIIGLMGLFVYDVILLVSNTYNPFIYFRF